ncbi:MAG: FadR family transcriptional regulator [Deltaproteobacteria bacterium]|nr:FadR family transcriptional regulator [Deltaproteobacteria bacterium]MBW2015996.1 FadR family transcriptional regulator [Deltaproteobacteria bacterium]MBW2128938.1 FadR family transcriptional regulator [Deltaproteobacteria bacterium]MBW2303440.1 FadR family transcriptional regulator [Deltaproteobacteria bacterium]
MHNEVLFSPYTPTRAFEEVAEQIREVILAGKLSPGDRLPSERSLAEQFQVGRLTIREALRTLEITGFVEIRKGSGGGAFVASGNLEAVASIIKDNLILEGLTSDQITEARLALECAAVEAAVRHATEEDLERIARHIEEAEKTLKAPEKEGESVPRMIRFHQLIARASHNLPFILFIHAILEWARSRPILASWVPSENERKFVLNSYKRIFRAVRNRDADSARRFMKEHVLAMGELLREPREKAEDA